jgi:hypothetical protein
MTSLRKKFWSVQSAGKIVVTLFLDKESVLLLNILPLGTAVKS